MKVIPLLFVSLISTQALASPLKMSFKYVPHEGSESLDCTHTRIRDLPDWKVDCGNGQKTFTAHVIARKYQREPTPQTGLEVLYWITEPGETPTSVRKYHSTTLFLQLTNKTDVHSLTLFQGVENDQASLRLSLTVSE